MISKDLIKWNFSHYASHYDEYSSIQNLCASKLIEKVQKDNFRHILDIGCGTGNYTYLLKNKFPDAEITAIDISQKMVDVAKAKCSDRKIEFITADAEQADIKEEFDFISSNVSFQWFENLEKTLLKYKNMLSDKGYMLFSVFGPDTYCELNSSLKELYNSDVNTAAAGFAGKDKIMKILNRIFSKADVSEEVLKEELDGLPELLRKIKYTGTRGQGINGKKIWTGGEIKRLEQIYRRKFGRITVTYQVFFCYGY